MSKIDINELTLGQWMQLRDMCKTGPAPVKPVREPDFVVGETVLIRTVTMFWIGTVTRQTSRFVHLEPAAWIADTGRFYDALVKGSLNEVEPCKGVARVALGSIVDVVPWLHAVPAAQK